MQAFAGNRCSSKKPGAIAQDGGSVVGSRSAALTVDDQRRAHFAFDVSANEGVHHITVMTPNGKSRLLDFWAGPMPILRSTASTR